MSPAQMFGDISSSLPPEPWQGAWSLGRGVGSEGQRDNKSPVRTMASCGLFSGGGSREGSSPTAQTPCPLLPPGAVPVAHGAAKSLQKLKYLSSRNTAPRARAALSSLSLGKGRQAVTLHLQHTEIGYFLLFLNQAFHLEKTGIKSLLLFTFSFRVFSWLCSLDLT